MTRAARVSVRPLPVGWALAAAGVVALLVPGARLLGAAAVAAAAVALPMAWLALRSLRLGEPEPGSVFVGETREIRLPVSNASALFALRDVVLSRPAPRVRGARGARGRSAAPGRPAGLVLDLPAGASGHVTLAVRELRRGRVDRFVLVAETTFPLALARARAELPVPADLLVLPRPGAVRRPFDVPTGTGWARPDPRARGGDAGEFHALREWREGESLRRIHWKASARRGRLVLRELVSQDLRPVELRLATAVRRMPSRGRHRGFERAVQTVATLGAHFLAGGRRVSLVVGGEGGDGVAPGVGRPHLLRILATLAVVQPRVDEPGDVPPPARRRAWVVRVVPGRAPEAKPPSDAVTELFADDPATRARFTRVPSRVLR